MRCISWISVGYIASAIYLVTVASGVIFNDHFKKFKIDMYYIDENDQAFIPSLVNYVYISWNKRHNANLKNTTMMEFGVWFKLQILSLSYPLNRYNTYLHIYVSCMCSLLVSK